MRRRYPVLLDIENKRVVVVGGGSVAARKAETLLECGARVAVVSPEFTDEIEGMAKSGSLELIRRPYETGDLEGAFVVVAATDAEAVNVQVWSDACARNQLVNVVDDPKHCNFIVPSVIRRGDVTISISTDGNSPALSRRLRQKIESVIGPEYGDLAALMGEARLRVRQTHSSQDERAAVLERLLDSDILELLRLGRRDLALERMESVLAGRS